MKYKYCLMHKVALGVVIAAMVFLLAPSVMAIDFCLGGKTGSLMGYINQGVNFGIAGHKFDTKNDFQQALFQVLLEARLPLNDNLRFFGSVSCNADWAYPILSDNKEWDDKQFDKSRDELFIFGHRRDIIKEFHFTWIPTSNWYFRVGKQLVVWGETDGFRLMDQINPLDQRRGMADVEFESTILPIWLVRVEYWVPQSDVMWLQDLGFEFIFNPCADFRGDAYLGGGNDAYGIWGAHPKMRNPLSPVFYPWLVRHGLDYFHMGSTDVVRWDRPEAWSSDGFEYGLRIKATIEDTVITLNGFYGRDNAPIMQGVGNPRIETSAYDGRRILHFPSRAYYPVIKFIGFTLTRDFENLYASALGGVAPVLRVEALYAFNSEFGGAPVDNTMPFSKHDELRYAIGIDWKIWARWLNPRAAFMISPQFYHRKIFDYPHTYQLGVGDGNGGIQRDDNYMTSLMINTTYFHNKIMPMVFWLYDMSNKANMFKIQIGYERSDVWNYTLGVLLLNGESTRSLSVFTNKDNVYFTVNYRFS